MRCILLHVFCMTQVYFVHDVRLLVYCNVTHWWSRWTPLVPSFAIYSPIAGVRIWLVPTTIVIYLPKELYLIELPDWLHSYHSYIFLTYWKQFYIISIEIRNIPIWNETSCCVNGSSCRLKKRRIISYSWHLQKILITSKG